MLRIGAWVQRFILNCKRQRAEREVGPINSREVQQQREWWTRRAQDAVKHDARYLTDRERLNLQGPVIQSQISANPGLNLTCWGFYVFLHDHSFQNFREENLYGIRKNFCKNIHNLIDELN